MINDNDKKMIIIDDKLKEIKGGKSKANVISRILKGMDRYLI